MHIFVSLSFNIQISVKIWRQIGEGNEKNNLSRLAKVFFLVFLPLLFIVFSQSDVVKAGDVSNNISSLTVSSNEISDGGQTTVKFTFDEHAQKSNQVIH